MKNLYFMLKREPLFILLPILIFLATTPFASAADRALAIVEDETVTLSDYRNFLKISGQEAVDDTVDRALLEKLLVEKVILHAAAKKRIEVSKSDLQREFEAFRLKNAITAEEFTSIIAGDGMTADEYMSRFRDKLRVMKLFEREVESRVKVSDREIEEYYSSHKKDYLMTPEKVEITAVALRLNMQPTRTEITELKSESLRIAAELQGGGTPEKIISPKSSIIGRFRPELLSGEFDRESLVPALTDKAFSTEPGKTAGPIWTGDGVYVMKINRRTKAAFAELKDIHKKLYDHLYNMKREKIFRNWVRTLWKEMSVTIY